MRPASHVLTSKSQTLTCYSEYEKNGRVRQDAATMDPEALRRESIVAMTKNVTGEIRNPLARLSKDQLMTNVESFAQKNDMMKELPLLRKGALIAQNPADFENMEELDGKAIRGCRAQDHAFWHMCSNNAPDKSPYSRSKKA